MDESYGCSIVLYKELMQAEGLSVRDHRVELTPYQQACLGSISAQNVDIAVAAIDNYKAKLAAAKNELFDMILYSKRTGDEESYAYIIQEYQEYIATTEDAIIRCEIDYEVARRQRQEYAGPGTIGAFVIAASIIKFESSQYHC